MFIRKLIFSFLFIVLGFTKAQATESCDNTFLWDEIKARTLCDLNSGPASCAALNALGGALMGAGAYKIGTAAASQYEADWMTVFVKNNYSHNSFKRLMGMDSDADGVINYTELLQGSNPGIPQRHR